LRQLATFLLIAGVVAGCAAGPAPVVQSSPGVYTLSKEASIGAAGLPKLRADALQEANQYCATNGGREALVTGAREEKGDFMLSSYTAQVDFRCLAFQTMRETTKAAVLECRERRMRDEFKTYRQSAECSNPQIMAAYQGAGYPFMDLVNVLVNARLMVADNLDKGAITEADAQAQSAELERRLTSEEQRRRAAAAASQPIPPSSDPGVYMQGLTAFQVSNKRPAKRVQHTALACNSVGFAGALSTTACY
jgi:hypothetical protein